VLVGVGMQILGVPYALLLGVLSFILEFIPILGTLASGLICVLLALTKGWVLALIVLIYFIVVHIIEGDIVGPRIVGKSIGLHPIVAMAALIAGGELFGVWGALFASPIAGVLQAFLITVWIEWKERHAREFQTVKRKAVGNVADAVVDQPLGKEAADKLIS
jgi:predicted PurR-regulated permease PerM